MAIITLSEVRDEGWADPPYSDTRVNLAIANVENYIHVVTGNYFEPTTLTLTLDGTGTDTLLLPFPVVSITEIKEEDEVIDLTDVAIYNRHLDGMVNPDDRKNPKIRFEREFPFRTDETEYNRSYRRWTSGTKNITVTGTFAYRDYDAGDVTGKVPDMIKVAAFMLLPRFLEQFGSPYNRDAWAGHALKRKETRNQECEVDGAITRGKLHGGMSGDWYIDQILSVFTLPVSGTVV